MKFSVIRLQNGAVRQIAKSKMKKRAMITISWKRLADLLGDQSRPNFLPMIGKLLKKDSNCRSC